MTKTYPLSLIVNGDSYELHVSPDMRLVDVLRGQLKLTGTRTGCDSAQCGACTVHQDGRPIRACAQLALQADGSTVNTVEYVGKPDNLHVMQDAFRRHHALQCGFCSSGMIMTALALADSDQELDANKVRKALKGNICRCTGYQNIVTAILDGAKRMQGGKIAK